MAVQLLLGTFLFGYIVKLTIRLLAGLGIGIFIYEGADLIVTEAETVVFNTLGGVPADMYSIMVMAGFIEGFKILFACYAAKIGIQVSMGIFKGFRLN